MTKEVRTLWWDCASCTTNSINYIWTYTPFWGFYFIYLWYFGIFQSIPSLRKHIVIDTQKTSKSIDYLRRYVVNGYVYVNIQSKYITSILGLMKKWVPTEHMMLLRLWINVIDVDSTSQHRRMSNGYLPFTMFEICNLYYGNSLCAGVLVYRSLALDTAVQNTIFTRRNINVIKTKLQ